MKEKLLNLIDEMTEAEYLCMTDMKWVADRIREFAEDNFPLTPKPEAKTVDSVEFPCPTCGAERFKTERRMNGDSWCRFGHKHPTKDFVRPATLEPLEYLAKRKGVIKQEVMYVFDDGVCYSGGIKAARIYLESLPTPLPAKTKEE